MPPSVLTFVVGTEGCTRVDNRLDIPVSPCAYKKGVI